MHCLVSPESLICYTLSADKTCEAVVAAHLSATSPSCVALSSHSLRHLILYPDKAMVSGCSPRPGDDL
jgi:hypothetical protein